ncbi:MAG: EamA family transporter [Proteobacteria bacterium]|nr:EamA family transporter [Pseudomonadota bacterium]
MPSPGQAISQRPSVRHYLLLGALASAWGSSFLFVELGLADLPPVMVALARTAVAAGLLYAVARRQGHNLPSPGRQWLILAVLAVVGHALPFFLIAQAQTQLDSNLAGIFIGATPLVTLVVVHFGTKDEKMTKTRIMGVTAGFLGIVVLLGPGAVASLEGSVLAGAGANLLAQASLFLVGLSFALNALIARRMPPLPPAVAACSVSLLATVVLLPFAFAVDPGLSLRPGWLAVGAVFMLGAVCTGGATLLFFILVQERGANFVMSANYLLPLVALILGVAFLGEQPRPEALLSMALISGGIWLSNRPPSNHRQ